MPLQKLMLDTPDGPLPLHELRNPVRDRAAVIVLQEALGVNEHLEDILHRVGAAGYHAVAPNLYHRNRTEPIAYGDYDTIYAQIGHLNDPGLLVDLDATIAHLEAAGWSRQRIGVVGFCIGGRVSFLTARSRTLGAAVGFYGAGIVTPAPDFADALPSLLPLTAPLPTPWLGIFGDEDRSVGRADVDALDVALQGSSSEIVRYPGAGHAFHCDARPDLYAAVPARDAWARTLAWFETHLDLLP